MLTHSNRLIAGSTVNFTVAATGTAPFAYQWRLNGVPLTDGAGLAGSGASSLTLGKVQAGAAGNYDVVVTNGVNPPATSAAAGLTVTAPAPAITTAPAAVSTTVGGSATFSVAATGTSPFTYQWQKDGVNLVDGPGVSGATAATLSLASLSTAAAGDYTVVITNGVGTPATSSPVALAVVVATVSYAGGTYTLNFDTLPAIGTFAFAGAGPYLLNDPEGVDAAGLAGWSFAKFAGTGVAALFTVDSGSALTGSIYSYGAANGGNRALGSIASNATTERFGVTLVNPSGKTITQFAVG